MLQLLLNYIIIVLCTNLTQAHTSKEKIKTNQITDVKYKEINKPQHIYTLINNQENKLFLKSDIIKN